MENNSRIKSTKWEEGGWLPQRCTCRGGGKVMLMISIVCHSGDKWEWIGDEVK